jgi:hypothetical protein
MIDAFGPYLLILILTRSNGVMAGIAIHEMNSFDSCQAALVQLEPAQEIRGYCIAKEIK